jgi:hypothetical protein
MGYHYGNNPMPGFDFYYGTPDSMGYHAPPNFDFTVGNASICDSTGVLQLFTNGQQLANRFNKIIEGSENYNDDEYFEDNDYSYSPFSQSVIILPYPEHTQQYFIFHTSPRYSDDYSIFAPFQLWYSIVDMNNNDGMGEMIVKQQIIINDTLTFSTLQAVRHSNGRDWWVTIHKYNSNRFYLILLTPEGITQVTEKNTGPTVSRCNYGQSLFSPDGSRYAFCYRDSNVIHLYHFNRCEGDMTYDTSIHFDNADEGGYMQSCVFSPDNHYLYASNYTKLYQIDTACWENESCKQLVGEFDGLSDPFQNIFWRMQLAPDDKIYMATWNGSKHLHVINTPNAANASCNFVQHQIELVSYNVATIPEFPNFKLGAIADSDCYSIPTAVYDFKQPKLNVEIFPNPAISHMNIWATNIDKESPTSVRIFGSSLQKIFEQVAEYPAVSISFQVNVYSWSRGIYFCEIINGSKSVWKKFIVQ